VLLRSTRMAVAHRQARQGRRDLLAKQGKNADDPLKVVIDRGMWLTGFDAQAIHTMYINKPMLRSRADAEQSRGSRVSPGASHDLLHSHSSIVPH